MEGIIRFHDDITILLTFVLFFVLYLMYALLNFFTKESSKHLAQYSTFVHHPNLEII